MNWLAAIGFILGVVLLLGILSLTANSFKLSAESTRKFAHVFLGIGTLSFPWLFQSVWPVLAIAVVSTCLIVLCRFGSDFLGAALHRVGRPSVGDLCYPGTVALVFFCASGNPFFFYIPILVLALADAAGALIGLRYGKSRYRSGEDYKTLEGSLAVGATTFLAVHVPLLLSEMTTREESLLIALLIAVVAASLEAIATKGLDNLYLPILVFGMLGGLMGYTAEELRLRLLVLTIVFVIGLFSRLRSYLNVVALIMVTLTLFGLWALLSRAAVMPALMTYVTYAVFSPKKPRDRAPEHDLPAVFAVTGPGLVWASLLYSNMATNYWGLHLAFAISSGLIALNSAFNNPSPDKRRHPVVFAWLIGCLAFIAGTLLSGITLWDQPVTLLIALCCLFLAVCTFWFWQFRRALDANCEGRWLRQFSVTFLASMPILFFTS